MSATQPTCPASRSKIVDLYFMEHRAKLIDIAAFLDRLDRAGNDTTEDDFRIEAFRQALAIVSDDQAHRASRILDLFSDHSTEPLASAAGMKGAFGTYPGSPSSDREAGA
ncbi:MAG: hypothetical protein V3T84_09475 [Phycisphaerales bacterium]